MKSNDPEHNTESGGKINERDCPYGSPGFGV